MASSILVQGFLVFWVFLSLEVKCVSVLSFLPHPVYFLIPLFLVICFELPITRTIFDFPRRFELSGFDCINKYKIDR